MTWGSNTGDALTPAEHYQREMERRRATIQLVGDDITDRPNATLGAILDLEVMVTGYERLVIAGALQMVDGNRVKAAQLLGLSRRTLYYKLRKHGL